MQQTCAAFRRKIYFIPVFYFGYLELNKMAGNSRYSMNFMKINTHDGYSRHAHKRHGFNCFK